LNTKEILFFLTVFTSIFLYIKDFKLLLFLNIILIVCFREFDKVFGFTFHFGFIPLFFLTFKLPFKTQFAYIIATILAFIVHGLFNTASEYYLYLIGPFFVSSVFITLKNYVTIEDIKRYYYIASILALASIFIGYLGIENQVIQVYRNDEAQNFGFAYSSEQYFMILPALVLFNPIKYKYIKFIILPFVVFAIFVLNKRTLQIEFLILLFYNIKAYGKNFKYLIPIILLVFIQDYFDLTRFENAFNLLTSDKDLSADASGDVKRIERIEMSIDYLRKTPLFGAFGGLRYIHNGFIEILANLGILLGPLYFYFIFKNVHKKNVFSFILLLYLFTVFLFEATVTRVEFVLFFGFILFAINKYESTKTIS
jgi:hypothetical protein